MIVRSQHKINKRDMNHANVDLDYITEMINRQVKDNMVKELLPLVSVTETDNGDEVVYESIVHVINHEDIRLMRSLIKEISEGGTMARFDLISLLRTF